jgi:uncharacterized protein (TIGR02722 family)
MKKKLLAASILTAVASLAGCQSNPTVYRNPNAESAVKTNRWQAQDVQSTALRMVDSLLADPVIGDKKPIVRFSGIKNKTTQHIDTKRLSDRIRTYLIRSRKVRVLTDLDSEQDQRDYGGMEARMSRSGIADKSSKRKRKYKTSEYHLFGEISEIYSTDGSAASRAYQITLNLYDYQTDELLWSDIQDIEKVTSKSFF